MKTLKSTLSIFLCLAMIMVLFTGCKSNQTVSEYSVWEDEVIQVEKDDENTDSSNSDPSNSDPSNIDSSNTTGDKSPVGGSVAGSYFPKRNVTGKTISVYWGGDAAPDYLKKTTEKFEKAYGCKVEYLKGSWNNRVNEIASYVNAGKAPDAVIGMVGTDFPLFASSGLLSAIGKNEFDFNSSLIDKNTTDNVCTWYGKTYAIGAFDEPEVIIYNKTLIEDMGYDTPSDLYADGKWTWDAMRTLAKKMSYDKDKDGKNDVYGFSCWGMDALVSSNNTWYLNKAADNSISLNFSSNAVREAYQLVYDMQHTDKSVIPGLYDGLDSIKNGTCAMYVERSHYLFRIQDANKKYEYDFAPIPIGPSAGGKNYRLLHPWVMGIGNGSDNREGALAYIEMILSVFADQSKVGPKEDTTKKYTKAQQKIIAEIKTFPAAPMVATGYGKFNEMLLGLNVSRSSNVPYTSAVDGTKASMEAEIKMAMTAF
jgi:ABC-type glycerol-3-phosphate transport system substrate-binding protein